MGFADDIQRLKPKIDEIMKATKKLTDGKLSMLEQVSKFKKKELDSFVEAAEYIKQNQQTIVDVSRGIKSIEKVLTIQNQVQNVSDYRDVVSVVAGSISDVQEVKTLGPSICQVNGLSPTLNEIVSMKQDIEMVLFNKDKIEDINVTMSGMQDALQNMEDMKLKVGSQLEEMKNLHASMVELNADTQTHARIASFATKQLHDFQVKTFSIEPDRKGYSKYEPKENTLNLFVPKGKEGDKGEPGEGRRGQRGLPGTAVEKGEPGDKGQSGTNGQDFNISIYGMRRERSIYGNRAVGTSFLSLDETPCMIYFRNSNTLDSWTKGQPFGISEGDFSISEIAGAVLQLLNEKGAANGNKQS